MSSAIIRRLLRCPDFAQACIFLACLTFLNGTAYAQEAAGTTAGADADRSVLEEIIVTAQKRGAEELQDVPISIQAITGDTIESAGLTEIVDFAKLAPSLQLIDTGTGQYQVFMRGVTTGTAATSATQDKPLASVYLDDMPVSLANQNPNFDLFDIERIEVLRGPQGTLYGAGAMGGNIVIRTTKPDPGRFEAKGETMLGSTRHGEESYSVKGLVNIPVVSDKLGLRIAGTKQRDGGFIDNPLRNEEDIDRVDRESFRASVRWLPTETLTVSANVTWQQIDADDRRQRMLPGTQTLFDGVTGEGEFTNVQSLRDPFHDEQWLANVTIEYNLGWAQFFSSSSFLDRDFLNVQQGFIAEFFDKLFNGDIAVAGSVDDDWKVEDFVQEVRLSSTGEGQFDWVFGVFYTDQFAQFRDDYPVEGFEERTGLPTSIFGAPRNNLFRGNTENEQNQIAVFGEVSYPFTDRLKATVGLRWFRWEQDFFQFFSGLFNGGVTIKEEKVDVDKFTPKFSLSYDLTEDAMIYGTASKGFRLGGVNDPVPTDLCAADLAVIGLTEAPSTFGPDSLWNYEVGAKTSWFDRRLTLNATGYYIDWSDIQTRRNLPGCGFFFTENVGEARSVGVEFEMAATPIEGLDLVLAGAYTDSELTEDVPNLAAEKGDPAPFVPEFSLSATIGYSYPLTTQLNGFVRFDFQHVASRFNSYQGDIKVKMPSYELGNLFIGIEERQGRWAIEGFVRNLWDDRSVYIKDTSSFLVTFGSGVTEIIETPRTIGIRLRGRY